MYVLCYLLLLLLGNQQIAIRAQHNALNVIHTFAMDFTDHNDDNQLINSTNI